MGETRTHQSHVAVTFVGVGRPRAEGIAVPVGGAKNFSTIENGNLSSKDGTSPTSLDGLSFLVGAVLR